MTTEANTPADANKGRGRVPRGLRSAAAALVVGWWVFGAVAVWPGWRGAGARAAQEGVSSSDSSVDVEAEKGKSETGGLLEEELERQRERLKQLREEKEPPKPPFEFYATRFRPAGVVAFFKPRHWTALNQELVSNEGDFLGQLGTSALELGERTLFRARSVRMAPLAKEQRRELELLLFPVRESASRIPLEIGLYGRGTLVPVRTQSTALTQLLPHQFFFVVLSRQPEPYRRLLARLWSVNPNVEQFSLSDSESRHYQLVYPEDPEGPAPVSNHPLTWSPIAYVLWDDYGPTQLTTEQQRALVDWLHWGGQLIVSGHTTLLELRGSFLEEYLPADEDGTLELAELDELAGGFEGPAIRRLGARPDDKPRRDDAKIHITEGTPLLASRLKLRPEVGEALFRSDEGEVLVAERRVGRGRVVVSAFRLSERPVAVWRGFDHFFNALVLRRPGRKPLGGAEQFGGYVEWLGWEGGTLQPRRVSQVRYFSRDTIEEPFDDGWGPELDEAGDFTVTARSIGRPFRGAVAEAPQWAMQYKGPRVAEWDDFNAISSTARDLLHEASGITVPSPSFVLTWVSAYLVLLVPVNWLLFRALRRVELAWALVPVIALGFTVLLLRTHLNIGFTRAVNEVDIVEAYEGYPRGHVTRYTAVYTSTRTRYRFSYSDPTAVVLPFPTATSTVRGEQARDVVFRWDDPVRLEQLLVQPNSLGMVHAEQMYDLKGAFQWKAQGGAGAAAGTLRNGTLLDLEGAVVVDPRRGSAALGRLEAGAAVEVSFERDGMVVARPGTDPAPGGAWVHEPPPRPEAVRRARFAQPSEAPEKPAPQGQPPQEEKSDGTLQVRQLVELARQTCPPGELRLVGWFGEALGGQQIEPQAVRHQGVTLVVVHLNAAALPEPGRDAPWTLTVEGEFDESLEEEPLVP